MEIDGAHSALPHTETQIMQTNTFAITRRHTYTIRITPSDLRIGWIPMWAARIRIVR